MPRLKAVHILLSLATFSAHFAIAQNAVSARPGTLNYIEGQASLEGQQLTSKSVGHTELAVGQYLATANGKAELLLTPGVFLRLDKDSTVKMVSPDLTHTEVELTQGRASVEVDQLYKQNNILIDLNNGQTQLLKNGFYEFDAANNIVRVFKGEAAAFASVMPQPNEKAVKVKEGKQVSYTGEAVQPVGFDRKQTQATDALYSWSNLRSSYLGEANLSLASSYANNSSYGGGYASGWMWSPSLYSYTWLPGNGLLWNPFGYGFYSPYYLSTGGFIYGGYGGGYGGYGGSYGGYPAGTAYRRGYGAVGNSGYRGGASVGGASVGGASVGGSMGGARSGAAGVGAYRGSLGSGGGGGGPRGSGGHR